MSDTPQGPGWWQASDGRWYPPDQAHGYQPGSGPWGQAPGYGAPMYQVTNGDATTALVLGILGLVTCGLLGIAAVVYGNRARRAIDASGGMQSGRGNATAGIVMGWIAIGLIVAVVLLFALGFMIGATGS